MNNSDIKILLVDDEPDILEIVGYNLKNEGYLVYTAKNGVEGLKTTYSSLFMVISPTITVESA